MIKKSLFVLSMHKTATVLQERIFKHLAFLSDINYYNYFYLQQQKKISNIKHPCIIMDRHIQTKDSNTFDVLVIIRHPINRLISEYYSYGWTHTDDIDWIEDEITRKLYKKYFTTEREKIRKISLDKYVLNNLKKTFKQYELALNYKDALIIPYEFMMSKPKLFFDIILEKIEKKELSKNLYEKFKKEFVLSQDFSEKIIKGETKCHRRTLNHKEYFEKLQVKTIQLAYKEIGDLLNNYDLLCKSYNLDYYDISNLLSLKRNSNPVIHHL